MYKVIVGQEKLIDGLLLSLLYNNHMLIEGVPGLAKTLSVTTLAKMIQAPFQRIQFTPFHELTAIEDTVRWIL